MRVVNCVDSARAGNVKVSSSMKSKQLQLNKDITAYVIFRKKKQKEGAMKEIDVCSIYCGDFITKEKVTEKWLGDIFHQAGLEECVMATIKEREPKVKAACYEAAAIIEDWRAQCMRLKKSLVPI